MMEEILQYIKEEVELKERMITKTSLLQKYSGQVELITDALNTYYEKSNFKIETLFTALVESSDGSGLESILVNQSQIHSNMKMKDLSIHAISLKGLIVEEEIFPPSLKGITPLKVTINEVNLSSLVQAMVVESQKIVVNKKVESLEHKRKEQTTEFPSSSNISKQIKTTTSLATEKTSTIAQNQNISSQNIAEEEKPSQVVKKPKIILKSRQQQPSSQAVIQSEERQLPITIVEEKIVNNQPIVEEKPVVIHKPEQLIKPASSNIQKNNSKPKAQIGFGSQKLDSFFQKK